jgi:glucose/arabinose dehydrogenase
MKKIILTIAWIVITLISLSAQSSALKTRTVTTGLDTPWEILWTPNNNIWASERLGRISSINPITGARQELLKISDAVEVGEGGLLGMVLDPDFTQNKFVYVAYNYLATGNDYREKIVRYTYDATSEKLIQPLILLDNIDGSNNHNGCRMIISADKKLFLTTGDAQITSTSQNVKNINGKMLRINLDGSIPSDNPIANSAVWSWGHRNAQGLVFSPNGQILYSSEHGANSDDEVNIINKGGNYGWPRIEGKCDNALEQSFCKDSNVVEPIHVWTPTLGVAGMDFYNTDLIPAWKNSLLVTSLKGSRVTQLQLSADGKNVVKATDFYVNTYGRLRDICISPEGKVYIAVSNKDGRGTPKADDDKIVEITPISTSIHQTLSGNMLSIYPNPVTDKLQVYYSATLPSPIQYSLLNNVGQVMQQGNSSESLFSLSLNDVAAGIYYLQIQIGKDRIVEKIIK